MVETSQGEIRFIASLTALPIVENQAVKNDFRKFTRVSLPSNARSRRAEERTLPTMREMYHSPSRYETWTSIFADGETADEIAECEELMDNISTNPKIIGKPTER